MPVWGNPQAIQGALQGQQRDPAYDLQRQLAMAQAYGRSPAEIAMLQLQLQQAQQGQQAQQQYGFANQMRQMQGAGPIGGGIGRIDPWLQMMMQARYSGGGGGLGSIGD